MLIGNKTSKEKQNPALGTEEHNSRRLSDPDSVQPADENPAADGIPRVGRRGRLCACSQDTLTEEDFQNRRVWLNPDNYMSYVPEGVFFPLGKGALV